MSKHTPGPWSVRRDPNSTTVEVRSASGLVVCEVGDTSLEDEVNAQAIAALPALLSAIEYAVQFSDADISPVIRKRLQAALAQVAA
jgi:hypothetical protein